METILANMAGKPKIKVPCIWQGPHCIIARWKGIFYGIRHTSVPSPCLFLPGLADLRPSTDVPRLECNSTILAHRNSATWVQAVLLAQPLK
ncbi:hypothetical protein AAY473_008563 [Plecturocebus cupreus]